MGRGGWGDQWGPRVGGRAVKPSWSSGEEVRASEGFLGRDLLAFLRIGGGECDAAGRRVVEVDGEVGGFLGDGGASHPRLPASTLPPLYR